MSKNITLSLPNDVAAAMKDYPEVNWSAIARAAIINYIYNRKASDAK
jgi:hypothetical protein